AARIAGVPFICMVAPPADSPSLTGVTIAAAEMDLLARAMSNGQAHRALPLTISLCTAVAALIDDTLVAEASGRRGGALRLGMPSGILNVGAEVTREAGGWVAQAGSFYRTARRLFDGRVWVPG
ncbi:MAG TPA: PrpF domain-containing protein, partial [Acetobacteraceae bacterium]|nr:PrpF domain-containing protein [Acetobacteraceae bacterium]